MLATGVSFSQSFRIDSMRNLLADKSLDNSSRMEILLQLGWDMTFFNTDSARLYLKEHIHLAQSSKDEILKGSGLAYMGSSYFKDDKLDSALYYYQLAESHFLKDTSRDGRENVIVNRMSMGTLALQQNRYEEALRYYFKVIDYFESSDSEDWPNLLTAYANVGLVYNDMQQFDKALEYHSKALNISEKYPIDVAKQAQVQMFVAIDLLNLKKFDQSLVALDRAERMVQQLNSPYLFASFYALRARFYNDVQDYQKAILASRKALGYARAGGQDFETANILFQLGRSYFKLGNYSTCLQHFLPGLSLSRRLNDKTRERNSLNFIAQAYYELRNYKSAAAYFKAYSTLSDSIHKSEIQKKINEIDSRYQNKQKADSILVLKKTSQIQELALHKKESRNLFVILGAACLLLISMLFYRNLRSKHHLLKQSEAIHSQQIQQLEKERQLLAAQSLMKGQEQERSRLAKDLHDGVGGLLSGVKLSLSTMKGNVFLSEDNAMAVTTIIDQLDSSITELRRVSHNMMPEALIKYGLKEALQNYCESLDRSGAFKVRLQTYGLEERLEQDLEIILYRIVQELLNNAIKHAAATLVLIQLLREEDRFTLTVEDDGKGFDINSPDYKSGAGLENVRARVSYLNGLVDINTKPGEGTSITVEGKLR